MQRRQQHPAATQGGSSLGEVWLWVSHRLASCRVVAGQGGNAHRVAACRGCHPACCTLHRVPGLSLDLKQPLREKLSPSCQLVPGFVPFPAGGIARSTAGEERGLAEPEPSSWLTHGLPGCGAPAPGCSGTQDTPWPGDIPLHLAPSPVTCQQRPLVLAPLPSHGVKRPGKCSPRWVPAASHPCGLGIFCPTTRTHHEAAPRGCAWVSPQPAFGAFVQFFGRAKGRERCPKTFPACSEEPGTGSTPGSLYLPRIPPARWVSRGRSPTLGVHEGHGVTAGWHGVRR